MSVAFYRFPVLLSGYVGANEGSQYGLFQAVSVATTSFFIYGFLLGGLGVVFATVLFLQFQLKKFSVFSVGLVFWGSIVFGSFFWVAALANLDQIIGSW